jgi:hypothetical protein
MVCWFRFPELKKVVIVILNLFFQESHCEFPFTLKR